jgi:hypothetical protein
MPVAVLAVVGCSMAVALEGSSAAAAVRAAIKTANMTTTKRSDVVILLEIVRDLVICPPWIVSEDDCSDYHLRITPIATRRLSERT